MHKLNVQYLSEVVIALRLLVIVVLILLAVGVRFAVLLAISALTIVLVIPKALVKASTLTALAEARGAGLMPTACRSVTPIRCHFPCVHLREEKTKNGLTIGPVQITQLNSDLLLLLRSSLLVFVVLVRELGTWLDKWQKFWLLVSLVLGSFLLQLASLLFLNLFKCLKEELLNVTALV